MKKRKGRNLKLMGKMPMKEKLVYGVAIGATAAVAIITARIGWAIYKADNKGF